MKRLSIFISIALVAAFGSVWGYEQPAAMKDQLAKKIEHYRESTKFKDSVLGAVAKVPRDFYVPENLRTRTYEEASLPIGYGQTITNMWFVTYMTDLIDLKPTDKVLEIGTGSGYQASILYQITKDVYSIEIVESLSKKAVERWKEMGFTGIKGKAADGYFGWPENGPFDKIIVTCAADHVPTYLLQQLKPNGIMVIPVGNPFDRQTLLLIRKKEDGKIVTQRLNSCKFVPFTGKMLEKYGKK
jgi:protein-L-isoaspartate(D-aspartate) O-methyltransferase